MADFYIATEDSLSEAVAELLVRGTGHVVVGRIPRDRRRHAGFGYLRARFPSFVASCHGGLNFFLLTDLDTCSCPPQLLDEWFAGGSRPKRLMVRIAVREVETWLMADRVGLATWLGVREDVLLPSPETCRDPKTKLLSIASKSQKRDVRYGLLPRPGAVSRVGLEYNDLLRAFAREHWCIEEAANRAPSLARALQRLREFR
ncbi:MAG: hypothetical protein BWK76_20240 [Desulfobulbaceae bacterium A2]|nr:MAG: hypothetical protein BWK76_20240 [Desulfobulbaceae bacterium A2]